MIPLCLDQGVGLIPWSPLARGFLTGSRSRQNPRVTARATSDDYADRLYFREEDFTVLDRLLEVSRDLEKKPAQVALAWVLSVPGVVAPIVGATRVEHLEDAVAAVELRLSGEDIARLEEPYRPHTVQGHEQPNPREGTE